MNDKNYIIAIDSGTQSIRAVLFDRNGEEIAIEQADYEPYFSLAPGWAEQRTEDYWDKLCRVCRGPVSYTHLRAHATVLDLVCRLLLEKKNTFYGSNCHSLHPNP